jgi:hypothetical protein
MVTIFHMQMQMGFGGLQYTLSQFADACRKTDWGVPRAVASFGYYTLLSRLYSLKKSSAVFASNLTEFKKNMTNEVLVHIICIYLKWLFSNV